MRRSDDEHLEKISRPVNWSRSRDMILNVVAMLVAVPLGISILVMDYFERGPKMAENDPAPDGAPTGAPAVHNREIPELNVDIDHATRTVKVMQKGDLVLEPATVEIPFAAIKSIAGHIIDAEGAAERKELIKARGTIVRPSSIIHRS
jgi:hypothetical protein